MLTSNDVPVLPEYCWHHKGPECGGWGCVQCYVEQNLARFFEDVAQWVREFRVCNGCGETYALGSLGLTRQLLLTYCCVLCAVENGMDEEEAEGRMQIRVTLDGVLVDGDDRV